MNRKNRRDFKYRRFTKIETSSPPKTIYSGTWNSVFNVNINDRIGFGKYKGLQIKNLYNKDYSYYTWFIDHFNLQQLDPSILKLPIKKLFD